MVILGPVVFAGFEVPEHIAVGGRQALAVHRLPGGARVVDAMGADDAAIEWGGVMAGVEAAARVRLLDGLRRGGQAWPLAWDGWRFSVVVQQFAARTGGPFWAPYRIRCAVLTDDDGPDSALLPGVLNSGGLDMGADAALAAAGTGLAGPDFGAIAAAAGLVAQLARQRVLGNVS